MEIPAPAYTTIGAISAAIIAGGISFLVTVLSKDQKTSEFRQAWIDSLRNDIAELISLYLVITDIVRGMRREGKSSEVIGEYLVQKDEHFCKLEIAEARIKLRLNPKEHNKLFAALLTLRQSTKTGNYMDSSVVDDLVAKLIAESQDVLKKEWKRVKRGEPVFVATKVVSILIIFIAITLWAVYANYHFNVKLIP